jgi:thiosulfate/3-mercaptopyruvate sulfurtransferase
MNTTFLPLVFGLFIGALLLAPLGCGESTADGAGHMNDAASAVADRDGFETFIDADELRALRDQHSEALVLIDARKPAEYDAGHLPGAINLPPSVWRTPKVRPGAGFSRHLYRQGGEGSGDLDEAYYAQLLGQAGVTETSPVVVYGNHAGKADGSVPVMVLHLLGHAGPVYFLDGKGADRLTDAGFELSTESATRDAVTYQTQAQHDRVWDLEDVQAHLDDPGVVLWDTRSLDEWEGRETRSNARTGRLPGAVRIDYADLFTDLDERLVLPRAEVQQRLASAGITPDKTVLLYCQTATRVSLPYQLLEELGYPDVAIYDASMSEYLNRDDTAVETE